MGNKNQVSAYSFIDKLRVLVVEDNSFNMMYAVDALKEWNSNLVVDSASNGKVALEMLEKNKYGLVLMDVQMPEMDGLEATRRIRSEFSCSNKEVTIIGMTAYASVKELEECMKSGMNDFVIKPFEVEELLSKVVNVLSERVSRIGNIFDAIPDLFAIIDEEGTVFQTNKHFLRFFFPQKRTGRKLNFYSVLPKEVQLFVRDKINGDSTSPSLIVLGENDRKISFELVVNELKYFTSGKSTYVILFRDISEREQKLKLEKEKELIQKSLEFRTQFLASISHEIRTPLNAISGMVEYLLDERFSAEQKENIEIINSSTKHLLNVVNDVLHLSRLESGKYELSPSKAFVPQVVDSCLSWFNTALNNKSMKAEYRMQLNYQKALFFDNYRINQVLSNLVSNAIKFGAHRSKITVTVKQIAESEEDVVLLFEVEDQGKGISVENQQKLFSFFGKLQDDENKEGAGLGLVISSRIVKLFEGEIGVESTLGKGSVFWFTVKLKKYNEELHSVFVGEQKKITVPPLKVLLVDDRKVNRKVAELILGRMKAEVDSVNNGELALEKIAQKKYDFVLMDIRMPVMDGISATKILKEKYGNKCPYIIGITANAMEGDEEFYMSHGMDYYMSKPFTAEKVKEAYVKLFLKQ